MIIARALYGLKSYCSIWRAKLSDTLMLLGYKPYEADSGVWMKQYFKPNGDPYYKYMLCFVDDLLHIGFNPKEDMDAFNITYQLKEGFGPPDRYLGESIDIV